MTTRKTKAKGAERIRKACEDIIRRSDEIVACSDGGGLTSGLFSRKEIRVTNGICCELALAVADSGSGDGLIASREMFERMREHVMEANDALAEHMLTNQRVMNSIINVESTLINLLVAADPTVRLMAGFAKKFLPLVKSVLTAFFTDIRIQLEADEGGKRSHKLLGALSAPVGALVLRECERLLRRYGDAK